MREKVLKICLAVLVLVFAFMFVYTVFFKHTEISDYSILSEWPEFTGERVATGEFQSDLMYWFTDHIPGRDTFIDYEARVRSLYGLEKDEEVITRNDDSVPENQPSLPADESSGTDSSEQTESGGAKEFSEVSFENVDNSEPGEFSQGEAPIGGEELCNTVLVLDSEKRGLEIFYGNLPNAERFAGVLNGLAEKLPEGVSLYSMVVPKAGAYYIWQSEKYGSTANANKENIDRIAEKLSDKVTDIDVYNTLGAHASEAIYYRTDHHWTALGAYYAAQVFAKKAGVPFADLSQFEEVTRQGYLGTLYKYSNNSPKLGNNPEDFVYYVPKSKYTATYYKKTDFTNPIEHEAGLFWDISDNMRSSWYFTFIYGDTFAVKVKSESCKNGRKLLIVKDSYGNPLPQYLLEGFEEIYIVDMREYKRTILDTVEEFGITDVLVVECSFSAVGTTIINQLEELCK